MRAMGAAITRCCDVALATQNDVGNSVTMSVETGTISVVDDFEPLSEVSRIYLFETIDDDQSFADSNHGCIDLPTITEFARS